VVIRVQRNGNYLITGPVTLLDTAGNPYQLDGGEFSLCRCGQSKDKPFCDDTHETVGFKDACKTAIKVQEEREG
jgi:CDGSH-type Zn-finger protein